MSPQDNRRRAALHRQTGGRIEILPYDRLLEVEKSLKTKGIKVIESELKQKWRKSYSKRHRNDKNESGRGTSVNKRKRGQDFA